MKNNEELNQKTSIIVCLPGNQIPPFATDLDEQLQKISDVDILKTNTIPAAIPGVQKSLKAVCIVSVSDKSELLHLLGLLEANTQSISAGRVRVVAINKLAHEKIPLMLKGKGCSEVLDFKVGKKEFFFKLNTYLKLANQSYDKLIKSAKMSGLDVSKDTKKSLGKIAAQNQNESKAQFVFEKALDFENDFWLVTNKKNIRYVLGRWLIQLLGPGPVAGSWELSKLSLNNETGWEWKIAPQSQATFQKAEGRWVFFGKQPEFSWQDRLWSFVSQHPTLAFYVGEEPTHYRMIGENSQNILVCENSNQATSFTEAIQQTIDHSVTFKEDKRKSSIEDKIIDEELNRIPGSDLRNPDIEDKLINEVDMMNWDTTQTKEPSTSTPDELPWLSFSDGFISIKLELFVKKKNNVNVASPILVELIEVQDKDILLDAPDSGIQPGEHLTIDVNLTEGSKKSETTIFVSVERFETKPIEGRVMVLACTTDEETRKKMKKLLEIYIQKQQYLMQFLTSVKG